MELKDHAKRIVHDIFGLKRGERLLVLSEIYKDLPGLDPLEADRWRALNDFTIDLVDACAAEFSDTLLIEYPTTGGHGKEPAESVWRKAFGSKVIDKLQIEGLMEKLRNKTVTPDEENRAKQLIQANADRAGLAIMAVTNHSTSHTYFRKLLTTVCLARYASMPLFDPDMFNTAMTADWKKMGAFTKDLAGKLAGYDSFRVEADNGTNITIIRGDRQVIPDTGKLVNPGSFGNLPAGEAFFAPVEGESHGTLVIEYAPNRKLKSPVTLTVEDGRLVKVEGDEPYVEELVKKLDAHPNNRVVAEMGFGTNDAAVKLDNILESEKIFGTVHIAFGDNMSFGGENAAPFHEDYLVLSPKLYGIKGEKEDLILKNKSYNV